MLVLLKTSKLVSKFDNPTSGAESPFSQQRKRFVDNLGRSSTSSSLLTVGCTAMVFNALQINSYVFSEEIGANAKKKIRSVNKRSTLSDWHLQIANSASIIGYRQWRRLGAGMQRLASAVPQLQHEPRGAYWQTKAFQTSRLTPNSHLFPNKTTTCGSAVRKV